MEFSLNGGCACGSIRYECKSKPILEYKCHCRACQRASGSGFLALFWVATAHLRAHWIYDGKEIPSQNTFKIQHKVGYSTLAQFLNVYHRTAPITVGTRITLVLNLRSVEKPFVDDNRLFYLAADNNDYFDWIEEMQRDVQERQLPAYQACERKRMEIA